MKLIVIDFNYLKNNRDWVFELKNQEGDVFYIMKAEFYKQFKLKSPITKQHLDSLINGVIVTAEVNEFDGQRVVTSILGYQLP